MATWRKSSFSNPSGNCVEFAELSPEDLAELDWRKSSESNSQGTCVELAEIPGESRVIGVRDSKNPEGPVLVFRRDEIDAWVKGAKAGEFDKYCS